MNAAEKIKSLLPRIGNEIHLNAEQLIDAIGEVIDNNRYFVAAPVRAEGTTVWRFEVPVLDAIAGSQFRFSINMPHGAQILYAEKRAIWALVNPNALTVCREFYCVGTGHGEVLPGSKHVGTVLHGSFVWHIFEEIKS